MNKITHLLDKLGIKEDDYFLYGWYIAKVHWRLLEKLNKKEDGKLILVSAINPTPLGEGKTTTTIGLGDALSSLGKNAMICLREPSLGPVFGVKGGAVGGGKAKLYPDIDINLHFTGDIHAVTTAVNLLSALIDNHIYHGNNLKIDPRQIFIKRCLDMNDRQLRNIVVGLGGKSNGFPREDGFEITAASEIMATLCLAKDLKDLKRRLGEIIIGVNCDDEPVYCKDLKVESALTVLLKDALSPNLVQTLEETPVFVHGGPFANIAHGTNSLIATKMALKLADYVVVEAGFGADLGAEKFFDIKSRIGNLKPSCVVLVASLRALKFHGGANKKDLEKENISALIKGIPNLLHHVHIIRDVFHLPLVVAINKFSFDSDGEIKVLVDTLKEHNIRFAISEVYNKGSNGGLELAKEVLEAIEFDDNNFEVLYDLEEPYEEKIEKIVRKVYGGNGVLYTDKAKDDLERIYKWSYNGLPVCMAKTQYSLSDNPKLLGKPENFQITINRFKILSGAGFIIAYAGDILTMPGLPKNPLAEKIEIDDYGNISGLL
ncbi:MAG: formate--tetrahydrofolate ligase [Dictyoglomus sp. NZ13-RE01]|nr:MAG: formate--tetrahydrofolate ligase [Dictyoglomus sp. NZ13-RE01]